MKRFWIILMLVCVLAVAGATVASNITISDIQADMDGVTCTMTVTWETNVKSSSKVYYGLSCNNLVYEATGTNCVTNHSVQFDVYEFGDVAIYYKVESGTNCETELSPCKSRRRGICISQ
jgi:hypothetical protein